MPSLIVEGKKIFQRCDKQLVATTARAMSSSCALHRQHGTRVDRCDVATGPYRATELAAVGAPDATAAEEKHRLRTTGAPATPSARF